MSAQWRRWETAPRFLPLLGALIGALGGAVYWLGAQIWPTSIAVVLSLATAVLPAASPHNLPGADIRVVSFVFAVLVKYNALMALSAANLPFALPANLALGLIMIAGHAASRALVVSSAPVSHGDLGIALAIGFAPAVLLGLPGLIGLVAAIAERFAFIAYARLNGTPVSPAVLDMTQQLTEVCFYLGALATWAYV